MTSPGAFPPSEASANPADRLEPTSELAKKVGAPLGIIRNPPGEIAVRAGESFELSVTLTNQGPNSATVDVFLDQGSLPILFWCATPQQSLALEPGSGNELRFQFVVPGETIPGSYQYNLVVDAPQDYPEDTPISLVGWVQVTPFIEESRPVNDPTFRLKPVTRANSPALLNPGELLDVEMQVHNRSNRVDQFRVFCPDLDASWYRVIYPEPLVQSGLVAAADGLELNPDEQGQIRLLLQPPLEAIADIYSLTVRLYSTNHPDQELLDIIYLQINAIYQLEIEFLTLVGKVSHQAGWFELRLRNQGNSPREIRVTATGNEEKAICRYQVEPPQVRLAPKSQETIRLRIKPLQPWRRPFAGQLINFLVEIEDVDGLPLLNDRFQGALVWEARPWWQSLLLVFSILIVLGLAVLTLGWWLRRPKPTLQIISFYPENYFYEEVENQPVRLSWEIAQPQQLQSLRLVGLSPDGKVISGPWDYEFTADDHQNLPPECVLQQTLICTNLPTDARRGGDYIFELSTFTQQGQKRQPGPTLKTNLVQIQPIAQPAIAQLNPTKSVYLEAEQEQIQLNFQISNVGQVQRFCIEKWAIQPSGQRTSLGTTVYGSDQIAAFLGLPQPTQTHSTPSKQRQTTPLQMICPTDHVSSRDEIPLEEAAETSTDSQRRSLPLKNFCTLNNQAVFSCQGFPTGTVQAGVYQFGLTVIPQHLPAEAIATQTTESPIQINPPITIALNVADQTGQSQFQYEIGKEETVPITWSVAGAADVKVQLLPAPGAVKPEGKLLYQLSKQPGKETITLMAKDGAGQQQVRSLTIETYLPPESTSAQDESAQTGASGSPMPDSGKSAASQAGLPTTVSDLENEQGGLSPGAFDPQP